MNGRCLASEGRSLTHEGAGPSRSLLIACVGVVAQGNNATVFVLTLPIQDSIKEDGANLCNNNNVIM